MRCIVVFAGLVSKKLIFQYRTLSLQFFFIASFFWHQLIQNTTKIRRIQTTWECCLISIPWQVIFCLPVLYNSFCPKLHGLSFQQNDYLTVIKEKFTYIIDITAFQFRLSTFQIQILIEHTVLDPKKRKNRQSSWSSQHLGNCLQLILDVYHMKLYKTS